MRPYKITYDSIESGNIRNILTRSWARIHCNSLSCTLIYYINCMYYNVLWCSTTRVNTLYYTITEIWLIFIPVWFANPHLFDFVIAVRFVSMRIPVGTNRPTTRMTDLPACSRADWLIGGLADRRTTDRLTDWLALSARHRPTDWLPSGLVDRLADWLADSLFLLKYTTAFQSVLFHTAIHCSSP